MKTAICTFCAQTGMLCKDCQTKINNGEVTENEVTIAKVAANFEKDFPNASKVAILKTFEKPEFLLLLVKSGDLRFLTGGAANFDKRLEKAINKPIKIIEKTKNKRKLIDEIFAPALVTGINTVFVPVRNPKPGQSSVEEEMIVVLSEDQKQKVPGNIDEIKEIIELLIEDEIRIEFR